MIIETGQYCEKCIHKGICKYENKRYKLLDEIYIPENNGDYDGIFQIRFYCKKYEGAPSIADITRF